MLDKDKILNAIQSAKNPLPLIEALAICANALERRNLNSPTGSDTAALAKLEALLKEVK